VSRPTAPVRRGDRPRLALVLSGGGARGAYEAGVMKYIREDLAGDLGGHVAFDILCGTSVGGIHSCLLAATADIPGQQGRIMCERWESMVLEELVEFGVKDFMKAPATLLGSGKIEERDPGQKRLGGVVDTRLLERMVRRLTPWGKISRNIELGLLESLAVTCTDIGSGKSVVFVESGQGLPRWSQDPYVRVQSVDIGPEHALASAALPILFPAIAVGDRFYCDGGLRQNTPLSPALRLGADKVLVIGLRHKPPPELEAAEESMPFPGAAFLAGKILNAFLLDHIDYDLDRLRRFNALIEAAHSAGDPEYIKRLDQVVAAARGAPYRVVGEYMVRPSIDLGAIAGEVARAGRFKGTGGGTGIRLLRRLAGASGADEADLLSYILFDGEYAHELVRMGYEDARMRHEELARFLCDTVVPGDGT
jgi:NTE family protein